MCARGSAVLLYLLTILGLILLVLGCSSFAGPLHLLYFQLITLNQSHSSIPHVLCPFHKDNMMMNMWGHGDWNFDGSSTTKVSSPTNDNRSVIHSCSISHISCPVS